MAVPHECLQAIVSAATLHGCLAARPTILDDYGSPAARHAIRIDEVVV